MARKKVEQVTEEPEVQEAEFIRSGPDVTHRVQVRLDEAGPVKADGRRGQIVIEGDEVPDSVVRWLFSPKCRKAERGPRGKRQAYVWIDDVLISNVSEDIPDADAPAPTGLVPAPPQVMQDKHLLEVSQALADAIKQARADHQAEIAALRKARDAEIAVCTKHIEEARERLAKELEREAEEIQALADRRAQYSEERAQATLQLAKDVELTATTRMILSKKMLQEEKTWVGSALEALKTPQGQLLAVGIAAKLGVSEDLLEMALGVAQAVKPTPGAPAAPSAPTPEE